MSDLISRSALMERLKAQIKQITPIEESRDMFFHDSGMNAAITGAWLEAKNAPTVDAVPVVQGRWVDHLVRDWRCSECGEKVNKIRNVDGYCYDDKPNYCPNCGAKMDGGEDDEA